MVVVVVAVGIVAGSVDVEELLHSLALESAGPFMMVALGGRL